MQFKIKSELTRKPLKIMFQFFTNMSTKLSSKDAMGTRILNVLGLNPKANLPQDSPIISLLIRLNTCFILYDIEYHVRGIFDSDYNVAA